MNGKHVIIKFEHFLGILLTLIGMLGTVCYGYGVLNQKVSTLEGQMTLNNEQHIVISRKLDQIIGKIGGGISFNDKDMNP